MNQIEEFGIRDNASFAQLQEIGITPMFDSVLELLLFAK